jgi:hypothetical protein
MKYTNPEQKLNKMSYRPRAIIRAVGSIQLLMTCLLLLAILVVWGTLYQVDHGLYEAHRLFFNSWVILIGGFFPFPGVRLCAVALGINQCAILVSRSTWRWNNAGLIIYYAGVVALLAGAGAAGYYTVESSITLLKGRDSSVGPNLPDQAFVLPVTITLIDFIKKDYPGTTIPCSFESRIHVHGTDIDRDATIAMNKPFRYRDYSLYQTSYYQDTIRTTSTLAIVKNPGRLFPPIAAIAIAMGLLLHFSIRLVVAIRRKQSEL